MERFIGNHFLDLLSYSGSCGRSQFAYRKFHGARDALLLITLTWLRAFAHGRKVGVYCSDVASAFDRVSTSELLEKLRRSIIPSQIVDVIADWLIGRQGRVIVQGCESNAFRMFNMTFQGTVWGPALWNLFFADAPLAMRRCGFQEIIFADDLNAFREFLNAVSNDFIINQLLRCQHELHEWGAANGLTFDPGKESFHVLAHDDHFGDAFRLLGVTYDVQLRMDVAVGECCTETH